MLLKCLLISGPSSNGLKEYVSDIITPMPDNPLQRRARSGFLMRIEIPNAAPLMRSVRPLGEMAVVVEDYHR